MPLPLVHLSVAHELLQTAMNGLPEILPSSFYLGAISPDAIHMREGWTRDDKRRIHVFGESKDLRSRLCRMDGLIKEIVDVTDNSLGHGWISHLVSDALWSHYVVHGYWDNCIRGESDEIRRMTYYRENDKIEYQLFREVPWQSEVWRGLSLAIAQSVDGYLTGEEVGAWRDRYLRWHAEIGEEPADESIYFTMDKTNAFIRLASVVCENGFENTFAEAVDVALAEYPRCYIADIN